MADIRSISYETTSAVTASNVNKVPGGRAAGFYANTAGYVCYKTMVGDSDWVYAQQGLIYSITIQQILSTAGAQSTTAGDIHVVYAQPYRPGPSQ